MKNSTCLGGGGCGGGAGDLRRLRLVFLKDGVDEGSGGQRGVFICNEGLLLALEHLHLRAGWLLFDKS